MFVELFCGSKEKEYWLSLHWATKMDRLYEDFLENWVNFR